MRSSALWSLSNYLDRRRVECVSEHCSPTGVCCGLDGATYYCRYHCTCYETTNATMADAYAAPLLGESEACPCLPGFGPPQCSQQADAATWIALILTTGAMLVLLIAWGFRCSDADDGRATATDAARKASHGSQSAAIDATGKAGRGCAAAAGEEASDGR